MTILQVFNYILPLVIVPFLFRILGPEKYGLIAFSQAFIQYFVIVTDYGFNLSATRDVSINRKDPVKVSEIFSSVMAVKLISTMGCLGILILLVQLVPFLQETPNYTSSPLPWYWATHFSQTGFSKALRKCITSPPSISFPNV